MCTIKSKTSIKHVRVQCQFKLKLITCTKTWCVLNAKGNIESTSYKRVRDIILCNIDIIDLSTRKLSNTSGFCVTHSVGKHFESSINLLI